MKASVRQQLVLLDLQDVDTQLARLQRRRSSLPERAALEELESQREAARQAFMAAQGELDERQAELGKIEDDVRLVTERRARDEALLTATTSPKEAQALQGELDTLQARQTLLEDRELESMQSNEDAQRAFDAANEALQRLEGRRAEILGAIASAEAEIDTSISAATTARGNLAAEVQGDLLEEYESLRARTGIGAARLRGNVSEASNMALTPAELSDINATDPEEIVYCPGTGAILVRAESE